MTRTRVACCKVRPHLGSLGVDCDEVTLQRVREHEVGAAAAAAAAADSGGGRTGGAESIEREGEREYGAELRLAQIGLQRHRDAELLVEGDAHLGMVTRVEWWWLVVAGGGWWWWYGGSGAAMVLIMVRKAPQRPRL